MIQKEGKLKENKEGYRERQWQRHDGETKRERE